LQLATRGPEIRRDFPRSDDVFIMRPVSPLRRELLIAAVLTPLYLLGRGYVFGTHDHAIHLAYIERAADPGFLPGDPLLAVAAHHPSIFFSGLALLSRLAPLEVIYFVGHALSVFAMLAGLRSLARGLWDGPAGEWAAAVAVAGAFVHRYVPGSIANLDPLFLPRVASFGPLLWALSLGARRRFVAAFALTGLVFLVHATTASHTAAVLWAGCAFGGRANRRACVIGPAVFLAAAAPLLILVAVHGGPGIPTPAPVEWIQSLKLHFPFHHFPVWKELLAKAAPAAAAVLLGIAVSTWRGAGRTLTGYLVGVAALFSAGGIGNGLLRWPVTIHLHLFEAGRILDGLAIVALGRWSYSAFKGSWAVKSIAALVVAGYFIRTGLHEWVRYRIVPDLYVLIATLAVTALVRLGISGPRRPPHGAGAFLFGAGTRAPPLRLGVAFAAFTAVALMLVSGRIPQWKPSGAGQRGYRMMQWAGDHLPADAVGIIPPYMEEPVAAFRYFARRRAIGSWKDGGEGTFDYAFQLAWERAVRDITGIGDRIRVPAGSFSWPRFAGWLRDARRSYHRMPGRHFTEVAPRYGASHVVREAEAPAIALPVVYRDEEYVLYALPGSNDRG